MTGKARGTHTETRGGRMGLAGQRRSREGSENRSVQPWRGELRASALGPSLVEVADELKQRLKDRGAAVRLVDLSRA